MNNDINLRSELVELEAIVDNLTIVAVRNSMEKIVSCLYEVQIQLDDINKRLSTLEKLNENDGK
jgi:hypothetical protein